LIVLKESKDWFSQNLAACFFHWNIILIHWWEGNGHEMSDSPIG
jgi:hypothetical protein